jgi:hypothetical protein
MSPAYVAIMIYFPSKNMAAAVDVLFSTYFNDEKLQLEPTPITRHRVDDYAFRNVFKCVIRRVLL